MVSDDDDDNDDDNDRDGDCSIVRPCPCPNDPALRTNAAYARESWTRLSLASEEFYIHDPVKKQKI